MRAALADRRWDDAWAAARAVDERDLAGADLETLADAAWWALHLERSMALRRAAYTAHATAGEDARCASCAWFLWFDHRFKGELAIASGWLARAERHAAEAEEGREAGLVLLARAETARVDGDREQALARCQEARRLGQRLAAPDVVTLALQVTGATMVDAGETDQGLSLLDDAMVSVLADELDPVVTGLIYCNVLATCMEVADVARAAEWAAAAIDWCERHPGGTPYLGVCRLHRVQLTTLRGDWNQAEPEAAQAADDLAYEPVAAAEAHYALAELCRHRGELERAEAAYRRAHELGRDPYPGLALLRLAQGRPREALAGLSRAEPDGPPLLRAEHLAACVEVGLVTHDQDLVTGALAALDRLTAAFDSSALTATADTARAAVALDHEDAQAAVEAATRARNTWLRLHAPYQAARAGELLGRAHLRRGEHDRAQLELDTAGAEYERLGALPDAHRTAALVSPPERPGRLTTRELEVLRLVAAGHTNREIADALVISPHTADRHVQNIFGKLGVSSRAAATAFAYEHALL